MNVTGFGNGQRRENTLPLRIMQDIDELISQNLRRLMLARNMKQNELARRLSLSPAVINDILSGRKHAGKSMLQRLCTVLEADVWEFYVSADTPIVADQDEREALYRRRLVQKLGVAESVGKYERYVIQEAQQEAGQKRSVKKSGIRHPVPITFTPEEREAQRWIEKFESLGMSHPVIEKVRRLLENAEKKSKNPKTARKR